MKRMIWAVVALLGLAAWADKDLELECPGVTFSTTTSDEGTTSWFVVDGAGAGGGSALRSPENYVTNFWGDITPSAAYAKMEGAGTLKFKHKVSHKFTIYSGVMCTSGYSFEMKEDDGDEIYFWHASTWEEREVVFYGDGEHCCSWNFCDYGMQDEWTAWLSDFEWTPAPAKMTVTLDMNGGTLDDEDDEYLQPYEYKPGDTYGYRLPEPRRKGWIFLGWHMDSVSGKKVSEEDKVAFRENITLVAKWGKNVAASIFGDSKSFKNFKAVGADKWYMVDVPDFGTVAEVGPKGKMNGYRLSPTVSSLQATTTVAGYLSFRWSLTNGDIPASGNYNQAPHADIVFYMDGKEIESEYVLRPGQTTERLIYFYVPAGKHTLKWEVEGCRAFNRSYDWEDDEEIEEYGSSPTVRLWGFKFESAGKQPDLQTWGDKVKKYKSWRTGDLARFSAQFKTRMIADPNDYEARILFAATRLGVLAENKQFTDYAKTFGFTVDWMHMSVTPPKPKLDKKSAAVNAMVDKTIALATPAINEAKAALAGISTNWTGSVTLDKEEWPIDETVAIDVADVQFALAGLDAALAGLNFLGAYDLTVNWPKVNDMVKLATKIPAVKTLPKIGETEKWEMTARCFRAIATTEEGEGGLSTNATGALVVSGSKLSLRLAYPYADGWLNETNQVRELDFDIRSGDRKLNVLARVYGEKGLWGTKTVGSCGSFTFYTNGESYHMKTNVTCSVCDWRTENDWKVPATITIRGNELMLTVDMAKVNLGTKKKPVGFAKKSWSVANGSVSIGEWDVVENPEWASPWWDDDTYEEMYPHQDEETGEWVDTNPDIEQYVGLLVQTGEVRWEALNEAERKALKFINDQTAMFSKVRDASRLGASRRQLKAAMERALAADGKAQARPEGGDLHFFEYDPEMEAKIAFARSNTQRALDALDATNSVNFAEVAAEYDSAGFSTNHLMLADFDYTLLPNDEGMTRIYLGALFDGKITRDLLPPMRTNAYGEIVPDFDAMQDPTIGGLIPDMTHEHIKAMSGRFEAERELDHGEPADVESLPKPGEKVALDFSDYKGCTASGLPKGWTWNKTTGVLTGTAASTFTVTFTSGKNKFPETVQIGPKPAVLLFSDDETAVAVAGTGLYSVGATVKAVAAVKNGFAFGGWYGEDGELVSPLAAYSFKMTREDVSLLATTIPLENDKLQVLEPDDPTKALSTGEEAKFSLYCESVSPFSVSAAGLPPGLVVSNDFAVMDGSIVGFAFLKGVPTKAGVYYTTFVAKNNGGFKRTVVIRFVVDDAEESVVNTANIDLGLLDMQQLTAGSMFNMATEVPPDAKGSVPKSIKAKGVPDGMKATLANGELRFGGTPTTAGKYTLDLNVTYANKKTARTTKTIVVHDNGSLGGVYVPTGVLDNDPDGAVRGTAAYAGVKQYGQVVKFTATTKDKKKWFFGGWFLDEACTVPADEALPGIDYRASTVSAQIGDAWAAEVQDYDGRKGMYARFVTKAEEAEEEPAVVCDDVWRVYDAETGAATSLPVSVDSATKPTLTAKGLPAGTKLSGMNLVVSKPAALVPGWYNVTLSAKTAAGNTVTKKVEVLVPNVTTAKDMGLIEGLYTGDEGYTSMVRSFMKAGVKQTFTLDDLGVTVSNGWTLAVTGLPKGWTYNAKTGEFSGVATKVGKTTVTFTVSQKSGKKTTSYKATATFDLDPLPTWATGAFVGMVGNAYVRMDVASNGTISGYRQDAVGKKTFTATGFTANEEWTSLSATLTGKGVSLAVDVGAVENLGVEQGRAAFGEDVAFNSPWGIDGAEPLPVFSDDAAMVIPDGRGDLTLKFGAKGAVTCTYKVGKNSSSGSTQICAITWDSDGKAWTADIAVALAVKKDKKGKVLVPALLETVRMTLPADDEGKVNMEGATASVLAD